MNYRFGGAPRGGRLTLRERVFYIGGGAITFAALALTTIVVYSHNEADAHVKVVADESVERVALGTVVLLAPTRSVPEGAKLSNAEFKEVYWPRNEVPEGAIRRREDLEGMYAKAELSADQPILRTTLSTTPLLGGLSDLIPPGHRAATIEVNATSGVEGWATPGVHVDILVTYRDPGDRKKKTMIAIEDAVVLSYNGRIKRMGKGEAYSRIASNATVTLAVPVRDALKLHTARAMGQISLILRHTGDMKSVGNPVVSQDDFRTQQRTRRRTIARKRPKGFVKYTDEQGNSREMELRSGERWLDTGENDV